MQTAQQKKREEILDHDWIEDLAFVFNNISDCEELEEIWDDRWTLHCPLCGAPVLSNGTVIHRKQ